MPTQIDAWQLNQGLNARIASAINALYAEVGVERPTQRSPIVRLAEVIGGLSLTCIELADLTCAHAARALSREGVLLDDLAESHEPLAGFLYAIGAYGSIFVEQEDPVARRRFSAAHELGHYLLHLRPMLAVVADENDPLEAVEALPRTGDGEAEEPPEGTLRLPRPEQHAHLPSIAQMEREANQFAAEFLMPLPLVQTLVAHDRDRFRGEDLVWRLANDLLVSRAAMRWRLRGLGLFTPTVARWN